MPSTLGPAEARRVQHARDEFVVRCREKLRESLLAQAYARWKRTLQVQDAIVRAAESGILRCAYRPRGGGALVDTPTEWWGVGPSQQAARFERCSLDPSAPFSPSPPPLEDGYEIFVVEDDIGAFLSTLMLADTMPPPPPNIPHGSRQVACAYPPNAFWSQSARLQWPDDNHDRVFLGRAILEIGHAIYQDEWVDEAPGWVDATPDPKKWSPDAKTEIERILAETEATRELARTQAAQHGMDVLNRLLAASREEVLLISHFTYLSQTHTPCPPGWWLPEQSWKHLLRRCEIRPDRPTSSGRTKGMDDLYVDRLGLNRLLTTISGQPDTPDRRPPELPARRKRTGPEVSLPTTLRIFRERVVAGETSRARQREVEEIRERWNGRMKTPGHRTVFDQIGDLHRAARFDARGRLTNDSQSELLARMENMEIDGH